MLHAHDEQQLYWIDMTVIFLFCNAPITLKAQAQEPSRNFHLAGMPSTAFAPRNVCQLAVAVAAAGFGIDWLTVDSPTLLASSSTAHVPAQL